MNNTQHLIISIIAGSLYAFLTGLKPNLIVLTPWIIGGVLVDLDHFFTYSVKSRSINLKKLTKLIIKDYHENNQHVLIFHTIEFALFFSLIILKTKLSWTYLAAYLLHLACDGFRQKRFKNSYSWLKKWSLYWNFLK